MNNSAVHTWINKPQDTLTFFDCFGMQKKKPVATVARRKQANYKNPSSLTKIQYLKSCVYIINIDNKKTCLQS